MMLIAHFNVIIIIVIIINAVYCNTVAAQVSVRCASEDGTGQHPH